MNELTVMLRHTLANMKGYIKKSLEKFKQDALSKIFYDILKWIVPASIAFAATKLFPIDTSFGAFISQNISASLYVIILAVLAIISLTIIFVNILFKKKYQALQKDNFTDELTGLKNHKALKSYLSDKLKELKHNDKTLSLILIDIDDFKSFNTNQGPNTADQILNKVGQLLSNDKRITDETFRQFLRGDEFIVVANETNLNNAFRAAERKRKLIESTGFIVDGISYNLTVSCGVTEFKKDSDDYFAITDRTNAALVEAKKQIGKNCTKTVI